MKRKELLQLLSANDIFCGLTPAAYEDLLDHAQLRHFPTGSNIINQGEEAVFFGMMTAGKAKLVQTTSSGLQILIRYIKSGQEFGIITIFEGYLYPLTIQAVSDCSLLTWTGSNLTTMMHRYPQIPINALEIMVLRNQENQRRYRELLTKRVDQRLAQALLDLAMQAGAEENGGIRIDLPLTREDLAEYTGTTLYTVSRILSRWEREGIIESGRERVNILDLAALQEMVPFALACPLRQPE